MIVKIKKVKDLPIEEGKTYKTRFQTGELFHVTKIKLHPNMSLNPRPVLGFDGVYLSHKHLGVCPLGADRLVPQQIDDGFKYVCDCCGEEVNLEEIKKLE